MDERVNMLISGDSISGETLNRVPWRFSCDDSMDFSLELIKCNFQFSICLSCNDVCVYISMQSECDNHLITKKRDNRTAAGKCLFTTDLKSLYKLSQDFANCH